MLPEPVPADPGPDEDLAWLDRDPEREVWLDRARDDDEPPSEDEEYEDYAPLTAAELAGIEEAAADELLAVGAASTGRRGPGQPGSARVFPGESSSPAAGFGPWTPTGFVDTIRSGTMVYEERTGSGTGSQEVHPGI